MSAAKHTPGPWAATACDSEGTLVYHRIAAGKARICGVYDANEANARLIAAAPEMLRALQFYVDAFPAFRSKPIGAPGSIETQAQEVQIAQEDNARAVIAKATGAQV